MPKPPKIIEIPSARQITEAPEPVHETSLDRIYRENGITARQVAQQPKMTKALGYMGGLDVAAEYLRGSEDADAQKFVEVYDRLYDERDFLEYEGLCAAAGVSGKKLFGLIVAEATVDSEQTVALLTAIKTPAVIEKTMDFALELHGHRERTLVAKASGWLPRPKGSQTNIQINTANVAGKSSQSVSLPAFDQDIRELGERFQAMNAEKPPKMLEGK